MEDKEVLLKLNPRFNLIYELGMPTGRKIKNSIIAILIFAILLAICNIGINYINIFDAIQKESIINWTNIILIVLLALFVIKLIIHIIIQVLQYKNITYTFYKDQMEYKDTFWNQQTKIIKYENVKEIEVRKNIWERLNKCGIIILYTNAEKIKNKGMIIYAMPNVDKIYSQIKSLIDESNKVDKDYTQNQNSENTISKDE